MAENFNLIFGSQAPTTATWTDADYQTGWSTVGSTPPTAEQFDFLQNRADLKAKELNDALTPLVQKSEADGRQAGTIYAAGACVTVDGLPNGWLLECAVAGKSGNVAITLPDPLIDGLKIIDGKVTWKLRKVATNGGLGYRQPNTAYTAGRIAYHSALPTGYYLECTTQGTTSAGEITPSGTIGDTVSDGEVVWTIKNIADATMEYNIASGFDFNAKTETGVYECNWATNYSNAPNDAQGFFGTLLSFSEAATNTVQQIAMTKVSQHISYPDIFTRYRNDQNTWTPWQQIDAIVAKSIGSNGYIKYASRLIVQWGRVNVTGGYSNTTYAVYPISFTNFTTMQIVAFPQGSNQNLGLVATSTGNQRCELRAAASCTAFWIAIGY